MPGQLEVAEFVPKREPLASGRAAGLKDDLGLSVGALDTDGDGVALSRDTFHADLRLLFDQRPDVDRWRQTATLNQKLCEPPLALD